MTEGTDDHERSRSGAPTVRDNAAIPEDAEWELATQVPFDKGTNHDLAATIIGAVAESEDVSPMEIKDPPLYEVVDVGALETAFFGSDTIGQSSDDIRTVEFMYRGYRIVVRSDAWVQIYEERER